MSQRRRVFFVSDRTGLTVEALGSSLLTQFATIDFLRVTLMVGLCVSASDAATRSQTESLPGIFTLDLSTVGGDGSVASLPMYPTYKRGVPADGKACRALFSTTASPTGAGPPPTSVATSPPPTGATLADGRPLPTRCTGKPVPDDTVAFVADGRAWVLDPHTGVLSCLFNVRQPGPFAFGPQGDRVLLGGLSVGDVETQASMWPPIGPTPTVFDWGHPLGLAVVYASPSGAPEKRFMDDGSVEKLTDLPKGTYESIAYHPSGLALGMIVDRGERQGIWLSSNEGKDPVRLVFSRPDTTFSSVAFSPDGTQMWWIAQHAGALSEIHWMDLADRSTFQTVNWSAPPFCRWCNLARRFAIAGEAAGPRAGCGFGKLAAARWNSASAFIAAWSLAELGDRSKSAVPGSQGASSQRWPSWSTYVAPSLVTIGTGTIFKP